MLQKTGDNLLPCRSSVARLGPQLLHPGPMITPPRPFFLTDSCIMRFDQCRDKQATKFGRVFLSVKTCHLFQLIRLMSGIARENLIFIW